MRRQTSLFDKLPLLLSILANISFVALLVTVCQSGYDHSVYLSNMNIKNSYNSYKTGYLTAARDALGLTGTLDKTIVKQSEERAKEYLAPIESLYSED